MSFGNPEFEACWQPLVEHEVDSYRARAMYHPDASGPVLLAVHGLEEVWQIWLPMAELMHGQFQIISLDLPWRAHNDYGWSEAQTPSHWLADLIDRLPVPPHALLGHSFGSNTSLEYLSGPRAIPFSAAVLTSPFYRKHKREITWELMHGAIANFPEILGAGLQLRGGSREFSPAAFNRMVEHLLERVGPNGFVNLFRLFAHSPFIPLHRITTPTLVVAGQQDPTSTATGPQELAEGLPNGRVELLADFNHFCQVAQADEVVALTTAHVLDHLPISLQLKQ